MPEETSFITRIKTVFSIDLRALAVFRICLGALILTDLFIRAGDLRAFYTDYGVMPRALWGEATPSNYWSLHVANGEPWFQWLLFSLAAVVALLLIVGYRTRLMSILSWVLLASLVNRNHFILQAGDHLLVILAFWSMFLPLNARFSVDSALRSEYRNDPNAITNEQNQYFSLATVAMILQILYLYFFTALLKTGAPWRETFDAGFLAVSLEHFATPIGAFLREFPGFLKLSTASVFYLELVVLFVALSPWLHVQLRLISVLLLYLLHLSFLVMLHIGLFPLIDFTALLLLIPTAAWNWLAATRKQESLIMHFDRDCGFCVKMCLLLREFCLPRNTQIVPAQDDAEIGALLERERSWVVTDNHGKRYVHSSALRKVLAQNRAFKPLSWLLAIRWFENLADQFYRVIDRNRPRLSQWFKVWLDYRPVRLCQSLPGMALAAFFLYAVTVVNITGLKSVQMNTPWHVDVATRITRTSQRWGMFAPFPLRYSLYPVVPGKLRDGTEVDLFNNKHEPADWTAPAYIYPSFKSYRWRKLHERIDSGVKHTASGYASYLCTDWNKRAFYKDKQLATLEIHSLRRRTSTDGSPKKEERKSKWRHWCFPEYRPDSRQR